MRNSVKNYKTKDWIRLGAKLSLLFTEPKVRKMVGDRIKDGVDDITDTVTSKYQDMNDTVSSKYEDAAERLEAAKSALQGKNHWPSRVTGFLLGVGVGAGLGILLAPASGSETRESVRDKAVDMKNKVFESAAATKQRIRQSVTNIPFTGTEG
ncbi:MAG: YtxH domain-containing protein [Terriglobales bacterium]|jgi:gas vesicle protein